MNTGKILAIDDEQFIRRLIRNEFSLEGFDVITAKSGEEGISLFDNDCFDLVLLDIKLPKMDGIETLRRIKETSPDTEVIMITGFGDINSAVDCIKLGAADYVTKPFESELYGHRKGAFSGAWETKTGLVEKSDQGTLFLDEIGNIELELQKKFLRFLETRRFRRLGDTKETQVDTRIILATNMDLYDAMKKRRNSQRSSLSHGCHLYTNPAFKGTPRRYSGTGQSFSKSTPGQNFRNETYG